MCLIMPLTKYINKLLEYRTDIDFKNMVLNDKKHN